MARQSTRPATPRKARSSSPTRLRPCSDDAADDGECDNILNNIRLLIRGLHFNSLENYAYSIHQMEEELNLDADHSLEELGRIQKLLLDICRSRLVELIDWEEYPIFRDVDWSVT